MKPVLTALIAVCMNAGYSHAQLTLPHAVADTIPGGTGTPAAELETVEITSRRYKADEPSPALRTKTPLLQLPQNIQVVTERTLRDQQLFDMLEGVTRNISGASRVDSWDNYANVTMRGGTIEAFRNGMNVKMPWGPIVEDLSMVERIEFVKGPAGFMLANGEPGGFYNVVTKKPTGVTKGEATITLGSYDTYRTTLDLDGNMGGNGKLLYRLNLMGQLKNHHRDFDYNNRYSLAPVLRYQFNANTSLTAEYTHQFMRMAMLGSAYLFSPRGYGELPGNFTNLEPNLPPTNISDHSVYLQADHRFNERWRLTAQTAFFRYRQEGTSIWPAYPDGLQADGTLTRSIAIWDAASEARLGQAFVNGQFRTGAAEHHVLAGLDMGYKDYYADFYQTDNISGFDMFGNATVFNIYQPVHGFVPPGSLPEFDRSVPLRQRGGGTLGESYRSLYVQDELRLFHNALRLTLAGRHTSLRQHSYGTYSDDDAFTPRIGLSWSADARTSLYALYDKSFVAQQGADSANKPFVPVTGNSMETGIKRDWLNGRFNTTISVYRITRNNVVSYIPGPGFQAVQTGQTRTQGIEADLRGELVPGINLILNYAFTRAKVTRDEDPTKVNGPVPNANYADHISNAWLSYHVRKGTLRGLGAALGYQYQAKRKERQPDYFRADGNISWQEKQVSVALNVNNLFNRYLLMGSPYEYNNDVSSTEYYYQTEPGTNFRLSFGYRF